MGQAEAAVIGHYLIPHVHSGHQITVRQVAPGVLREPENDWTGPRYWRVRALGQMALF